MYFCHLFVFLLVPSSAAVHLSHLFILAQGQQAPRCRLSARVREHTAVGNSQQKFHSRSSQWAHSCVFIASHCWNESQIYSCGPVFEHFKRVINLCRLGVGGNNCMKAYIPPPKKRPGSKISSVMWAWKNRRATRGRDQEEVTRRLKEKRKFRF